MGILTGSFVLDALILLLGAIIALYLYLTVNLTYWSKRGVPSVHLHLFRTSLDRLLFRKAFGEINDVVYKGLTKLGASYGGYYELRKPMLMIVDPELLRNFFVKDFDHFLDRRSFGGEGDSFAKSLLV